MVFRGDSVQEVAIRKEAEEEGEVLEEVSPWIWMSLWVNIKSWSKEKLPCQVAVRSVSKE